MANLFIGGVDGTPADVTQYNANWVLLESSLADLGAYVISGLAISAGAGLSVNVATGTAIIGGHVAVSVGFAIGGLAPSTTNHIYLLQNGTGTSNTSGTAPSNSVKLGTALTDGSGVLSVAQTRASGRQTLVRHENLVHGAGAGHPRAVDLSQWHATNDEGGNETKGTLPAGALPATGARTDTAQTWTADQTFANGTDLILQTGAGSMIGTGATQKLGFFGATPIVQPANTVEITTILTSLGLRASGGSPELNLNGGLLNVGAASFSGVIGGASTTAFSWKRFALTFPSDANYTLAAGEADAIVIDVQAGVVTATRDIILPGTGSAFYIVVNRNAQAVRLKTSGGTGITIAAARSAQVYLPTGVNCFRLTPDVDFTV